MCFHQIPGEVYIAAGDEYFLHGEHNLEVGSDYKQFGTYRMIVQRAGNDLRGVENKSIEHNEPENSLE
jgi:hypothetical protein